jgi:hypothetical protein
LSGREDTRERDTHTPPERWPLRGNYGPWPVPDLARIPREHWKEVLLASHPNVRRMALSASDADLADQARIELEVSAQENEARRRAKAEAAFPEGLPVAELRRPRTTRPRQVNFRLAATQYDDLVAVADLLGLRPAQTARLLTTRGVQQVLREARPS